MRTIIAGSRRCVLYEEIKRAMDVIPWTPSVIISGTARGADRLGELYGQRNNIPVERFPANWDKYGKSAGFKRNEEMARNADALVALWDFNSKGTNHMINIAKKMGLEVYIHKI